MRIGYDRLHVVVFVRGAEEYLAVTVAMGQAELLRADRAAEVVRLFAHDPRPRRQQDFFAARFPEIVPPLLVSRRARRTANRQYPRGFKEQRGLGPASVAAIDEQDTFAVHGCRLPKRLEFLEREFPRLARFGGHGRGNIKERNDNEQEGTSHGEWLSGGVFLFCFNNITKH